ncbi:2-oxoacid:acceptor oxidoreductase family protein [Desulfoferrobacter suflitae]|uniref:2-oxoacid:acceptor oxidoreductase family protein n=1 Tax=Desulfoferrobacter suflitae TaxID=2865782 RepID=UPI002164A386|nr:2-oxoacid:acceptor oxidoreductase family protein [Desulfoferrobacter suflitae]MCK8601759.1 2-oxoacid:acceptor oxidoreductase family protein [Desulfoferrobacter suflitae]
MKAKSAPEKIGHFRREVLITGFGGQGIVLAGNILGRAASLGDHRESTLTQSYGPEARGGACSAQVIISDATIHYPYVRNPDIVVCMSQGGFDKFAPLLRQGGTLIIDQDLVQPGKIGSDQVFSVPATRFAEEMGRKMMANIVMLGFLTAVTESVTVQAALRTVEASVPKGTEQMNIKAFNKGYDFGLATLKGRRKKAAGVKGVK